MGKLKPGATYIYERVDGVTYARESGSLQREAIGWDADSSYNPDVIKKLEEDKLWGEIRRAAETNNLLRETLERAKIIYELSKKDNGKNKHVDLFKDMIPAVDLGLRELWDAATEDGRKEIKGDLWNLNRYISSVKTRDRELQEHYLLTVNEFYNKNWADISKHPKLQWLTLTMCSHESKKTQFHEWLPLKHEKNKKEEFLAELFPNMKRSDIETLAAVTTDKEIKQYCESLGWDKKEINGIKL